MSFYTVFEREIITRMEGDREEQHGWDCDALELWPSFDTFEDARMAVAEWSKNDKPEIHNTRYGIGSISRKVYIIEKYDIDEDGFIEADYNFDDDIIDTLDNFKEIKAAWNKSKAGYYNFLDYKSDGFCSILDLLEEQED